MIEYYFGEQTQIESFLKKFYKETYEADRVIQKQYIEEMRHFLEEKYKLELLGKMFKIERNLSLRNSKEEIENKCGKIQQMLLNKKANLLFLKGNMSSREYLYLDPDLIKRGYEKNLEDMDLNSNLKKRIASRYIRKSIFQSQDLIKNATIQLQSQAQISKSQLGSGVSLIHSEFKFNPAGLISEVEMPSKEVLAEKTRMKFYNIEIKRRSLEECSDNNQTFLSKHYNYKKGLASLGYLYFQYQEEEELSNFEDSNYLGSSIFTDEQIEIKDEYIRKNFIVNELEDDQYKRGKNKKLFRGKKRKLFENRKKLSKISLKKKKWFGTKFRGFLGVLVSILNLIEIIFFLLKKINNIEFL